MKRVCCSVNLCFRHMWYRKSPPCFKSSTRYRLSLSWKACRMLTMNLCLSSLRRWFSLRTDSLLFLARMLPQYTGTLPCSFPSWPTARPPSSSALSAPDQSLPFPVPTSTHNSSWKAFTAEWSSTVPIICRAIPSFWCCLAWALSFRPNCSWQGDGRLSWHTCP